jgi:hypothetical protein
MSHVFDKGGLFNSLWSQKYFYIMGIDLGFF